MIVSTRTTVALRCVECGKLDFHDLSLFSFARTKALKFPCACGRHKFTVGAKGNRFWLQFSCPLCESTHFLYFPRAEFWDPEVKDITCSETGADVGFFGLDKDVREFAQADNRRALEAAAEELGDDYFISPEVMYETLNRVHDLAEEGELSCLCGNFNVEIDILPDRLELHCPQCGRWRLVRAENEEDLAAMAHFRPDEAGEGGWQERPSYHRSHRGK